MERAFIAEGPRLVTELAESGITPLMIVVSEGFNESSGLFSGEVREVSDRVFSQLTAMQNSQGVLGVFPMPEIADPDIGTVRDWAFALDAVQDPGNLGTVTRTLDFLGFDSLFMGHGSVDIYNPKTVQAGMGAIGRLSLRQVDLPGFLKHQREGGARIYGAAGEGRSISDGNWEPGLIVLGNEGGGLSGGVSELCHEHISIPKLGGGESLNVASACAVLAGWIRFGNG